MIPISDQFWVAAAPSTDFTNIQPRNTAAASGSKPRMKKSHTPPKTRRR